MKFNYTFPPMKEYTMPNGIRIIWLPDFSHPVLTVTLQIPAGRHLDPVSLEGAAELTTGLMLKGTPSLSSEAFAEKFENTGATLFAEAKGECITFGVRMLIKASDDIVPLFWKMICNPALDSNEFKRLKKEMLTGLKAEYSDPPILANRHFYAELFGASHAAGRNHSVDSVKRIALEHVKKFYNRYICPKDGTLIVAGALKTSDMQKKWEKLFLSWNKEAKAVTTIDKTIPALKENRIRVIDKPELSQTTLLLGHPCINELHEKKITLAIANYILGGGNFSSRLMARIRSETGQTYGIASLLACYSNYGVFTISSSTQNNQLNSVITSIFDVYKNYTENGATESEIEKAKQFATGNMAFELEGLNNVVEKLLWLRYFGRDNSYIESFDSLISPVDTTTVKDVLQEHFASENFVVVAVGKKSEILKQLESFGSVQCFKCRANPLKN